jgi:VIT1/CCC1 family predicted Fe2+/Mn2+ transporter
MRGAGPGEPHFMQSRLVHDIAIGMSDGLTVPFAIAAGLVGASVATRVVIIGGLSEIAAGSISMGLGGYLSARTDAEHYRVERQREERETREVPEEETQEIRDILQKDIGLDEEETEPVVSSLKQDRDRWVDFMMRFELGLEEPDPQQAWKSAATIGLSYAAAGFIPLSPYFIVNSVVNGLYASIGVTSLALLVFGYLKGRVTGVNAWRSALQTFLIGGFAAGVAFGIARLIG